MDAPAGDAGTTADARGPIDAAGPAVKLPEFGCLGWSAERGVVACVTGHRGRNYGESEVELEFLPLRADAKVPDSISLLHTAEDDHGPDELPPQVAAKLEAAVAGLTPLDRGASSIAWKREYTRTGARVTTGRASTIGGFSIRVRFDLDGNGVVAPKYHLAISATRGHDERALQDENDTIGGVTVRAFALAGTVIVESAWGTGDEGIYSDNAAVWRCTATDCQAPK